MLCNRGQHSVHFLSFPLDSTSFGPVSWTPDSISCTWHSIQHAVSAQYSVERTTILSPASSVYILLPSLQKPESLGLPTRALGQKSGELCAPQETRRREPGRMVCPGGPLSHGVGASRAAPPPLLVAGGAMSPAGLTLRRRDLSLEVVL